MNFFTIEGVFKKEADVFTFVVDFFTFVVDFDIKKFFYICGCNRPSACKAAIQPLSYACYIQYFVKNHYIHRHCLRVAYIADGLKIIDYK